LLRRRPHAASLLLSLVATGACGLNTSGLAVLSSGDSGGLVEPQGDDGSTGYGSGSTSGSFTTSSSGSTGSSGGGDDASSALPQDAGTSNCDFNGTWGSRITINVSWMPQGLQALILASGTGQIRQWIRGQRVVTGNMAVDSTIVCGVELPDFQGTSFAAGQTFGVRFPDSLFDNGYLPAFTVNGTLSGRSAGSTYTSMPAAALLGISMTNPTTDAWPTTVTTSVDMDKDGKPGVTINMASGATPEGGTYAFAPVDATQSAYADKLYVAIRQVTAVNAAVKDCAHIAGSVTIPTIAGKVGIDSHVIGCQLTTGSDCTNVSFPASGSYFVDNTQPVFTPTGTATIESAKIPAGSGCQVVRQMFP
jgi:hypothetical protein